MKLYVLKQLVMIVQSLFLPIIAGHDVLLDGKIGVAHVLCGDCPEALLVYQSPAGNPEGWMIR